ncbi:MAG: TolC family protein [Cyclobacteriaceae bacterium]|jgi:outer membrane protein TolC|nr:TolC family protein [Cyclobacteriaceae bacterium]
MKKVLHILVALLAGFAGINAQAQPSMDSVFVLPDSVTAMTLQQFYAAILEYHPVVKQAKLLPENARQEIRLARGAFDPKLEVLIDQKEFQDKSYYNYTDIYLSFPNRTFIEPKIGLEDNSGELLNPESIIPGNRQYFAGVNIPIGRGLFTDDRRTAIRQAELFQTIAEADQVKLVNKILLAAAKDYWNWYNSYYNFRLLTRGADIAREIFSRVKMNVALGEQAAIDSVQAKITLQTRLVERQEAWLAFQNAGIHLSNYLWDDQSYPLVLTSRVAPVLEVSDLSSLNLQTLSALADSARVNHPELIKLRTKINQLELERSLAREFLKPRLDLSYYLLSQPSAEKVIDPANDYKFGLEFSMPILLRKERSKVAITNLKIQSTEFEQTQAEREILNGITSVFNDITNTSIIIGQQTDMVNLYDRLLQAEFLNLENGESDLFKLNIQQEKLIQAQSKLLKLKSEYEKLKAELYWAAGIRNLNFNNQD